MVITLGRRIQPLAEQMTVMESMDINDAATGFSALAQSTRLQVLRALVVAGPSGIAAGELAEEVQVPSSTLSFHLKELLSAKLVSSDRDGRQIIYRADYDGLRGLVQFLVHDCCRGNQKVCEVSGLDALLDSPVPADCSSS